MQDQEDGQRQLTKRLRGAMHVVNNFDLSFMAMGDEVMVKNWFSTILHAVTRALTLSIVPSKAGPGSWSEATHHKSPGI